MRSEVLRGIAEDLRERGFEPVPVVCERLKVPQSTLHTWAGKGRVEALRIGRHTWVLVADVQKALAADAGASPDVLRAMAPVRVSALHEVSIVGVSRDELKALIGEALAEALAKRGL